jgi:hypothetical protein
MSGVAAYHAIIVLYTISAFVGVQYSVNLQNARCNNKNNNEDGSSLITLYMRRNLYTGITEGK